MEDLTHSAVDRQNILNNKFAIEALQNNLGLKGMLFEDEYTITIQQVSEFYEIDRTTVNRYISQFEDELKHNGYKVIKGVKLKDFKKLFGHLLEEGAKAPQLGVFNFRAFLNLGMLLAESEKAKILRSKMLDIVIDTLNKKLGGSAKYINQRDEDFFRANIKEPHYRKEFTSALNQYVEMGNFKYALFTDRIYQAIFKEDAKEYKRILQLDERENARETMYAEVLTIISSFESGLAEEMRKNYSAQGRKLSQIEMEGLLNSFASHALWKPLIEEACIKMASRDYGFRDIVYQNLKGYIKSVSQSDFERFLGEKSKTLEERLEENKEIFIRLKDR
jgi:hypothetical protein